MEQILAYQIVLSSFYSSLFLPFLSFFLPSSPFRTLGPLAYAEKYQRVNDFVTI